MEFVWGTVSEPLQGPSSTPRQATGAPMVLRSGSIEIDPEREHVAVDGVPLTLPALSYRLLLELVTRAPDTVSKDELIAAVWASRAVTDETLAQRVRLLRQALGDQASAGPEALLTAVRGRGYRWQLPVERLPRLAATRPSGGASRAELAAGTDRSRRGWLLWAMVLMLAVSLGWWLTPSNPSRVADSLRTVVVLPFESSAAQSHVALAMEEALRSWLTAVPDLAVRSRAASVRYQADDGLPAANARSAVDALVSGRVSIDDTGQVRVSIELIEAPTDTLIWSSAFEATRSVDAVFALQARIAGEVGRALAVEATPPAAASGGPERLPTTSIEAYDAFLLGRYHTFRQTPADLARAQQHLASAVAIDPEFAEAWASLGWAWSFSGTSYGGLPPRQVYPRAREAALRALSLKPQLGDARSLHADILTWFDWDFVAAEVEYRKALELDAYNTLGYALLLSAQERHAEAIAMIERRLQRDADDPYVLVNAAWRYLNAGDLTKAIAAARLGAEHPDSPAVLGRALLSSGAVAEALEVAKADLARRGREPAQLANLAVASYLSGNRDQGDDLARELEGLVERRYVSPVLLARVALRGGRVDDGFAHLREGLVQRSRGMIFLRVLRALDDHRDDPRYRALLLEMGIGERPEGHSR